MADRNWRLVNLELNLILHPVQSNIIIDTCLVSSTVTLKTLMLCYHYMSHKPSRLGLQTQSYCFATVMSPGEITSQRRAINIDIFAFFIYFMFTFLETSQVSSV